jgi:hypothetical protein
MTEDFDQKLALGVGLMREANLDDPTEVREPCGGQLERCGALTCHLSAAVRVPQHVVDDQRRDAR